MKYEIIKIKDEVVKIEVTNNKGLKLILSNMGASIRNIYLFDELMTLSPKNDMDFIRNDGFFGKTVGRTCGRIKNATYTLNGKVAKLDINDFGKNNLHSGFNAYHSKVFEYEIKEEKEYIDINFKRKSLDGENGHVGECDIDVLYRVYNNLNTFELVYYIKAIDDVYVDLTNHVYLNLSGNFKRDILNEKLYINASKYGRLNKENIQVSVDKVTKYYNFKRKHKVGKYVNTDTVLSNQNGYDNPYYVDSNESKPQAILFDKLSKVKLNLYTTYPIVHLYTNNYPTEYEICDNIKDKKYQALCLECEYYPNGINEGSTLGIIKAGNTLVNSVKYEFIKK